jgi:hypothetical protein
VLRHFRCFSTPPYMCIYIYIYMHIYRSYIYVYMYIYVYILCIWVKYGPVLVAEK